MWFPPSLRAVLLGLGRGLLGYVAWVALGIFLLAFAVVLGSRDARSLETMEAAEESCTDDVDPATEETGADFEPSLSAGVGGEPDE